MKTNIQQLFKLDGFDVAFKPKNGYVPVAVDKEFEDTISHGKLTLQLDASFNPLHHVRIYGRVLEVPDRANFSSIAYQSDDQFPQRRPQVTGDYIDKKLSTYPTVTPAIEYYVQASYHPTAYRNKVVPLSKAKVDIKKEDRVYFHYLIVNEENYLGLSDKGEHVYLVPFDQIFCRIRNKKLTALNNYAIVEKISGGEGYREIIVQGKKRLVKSKMIMVGQEMKELIIGVDPKRLADKGKVKAIGERIGPKGRDSINVGDFVAYKGVSEFENIIEGEEIFVMRDYDIAAKKVKDTWKAADDMVLIKPFDVINNGLIIPNSASHPENNRGTIVDIGKKVANFKVGSKVLYNPAVRVIIEDDLIAVPERHIPIEI